jgi:hypothetical protein
LCNDEIMRPLLLLPLTWAVFAQGTAPKANPEAYPVHAQARSAALGADFTVHTFSSGEQAYFVKGFLIVEVALFPASPKTIDVHSGNFVLRVNGRKQEFLPQPPSLVAAAVAHPEWSNHRRVQADASAGNARVSLGAPRPSRIPGMPIPGQPPQSSEGPGSRVKPDQVVLDTALPQGEHRGPVSGFLYFTYDGKTSGIKSLELRYEDAVLKLR